MSTTSLFNLLFLTSLSLCVVFYRKSLRYEKNLSFVQRRLEREQKNKRSSVYFVMKQIC